jgi:hypothetical protein
VTEPTGHVATRYIMYVIQSRRYPNVDKITEDGTGHVFIENGPAGK